MGKQEFLDKLRASLSGNVSAKLVEENVTYYADYINAQLRMGQPEELVMNQLGDPRLIAKSIITANSGEEYIKNNGTSFRSDYEEKYYTETREQKLPKVVHVHGWLALAIIIIVLVLLVNAVFSLISLFFPLIMMGGIVYFFIKVFRDWLN